MAYKFAYRLSNTSQTYYPHHAELLIFVRNVVGLTESIAKLLVGLLFALYICQNYSMSDAVWKPNYSNLTD